MFTKLNGIEDRFRKVESLLSDPEIVRNQDDYRKYSMEHSELNRIVTAFRSYNEVLKEIENSEELLKDPDPEIKDLAKEELDVLNADRDTLEIRLKKLLIPKDPNDDKNVIMEIRAGTGGEEAGLFAGDLFRMYGKYAETKSWKMEILSQNPTGVGGFKEVIAMIHGKGAFSRLKYESGTHRVQRVPSTEAQGRIHTSAVTVAVLPEAEEVEVHIDPSEIKIDVYRSTGPGGQSVNTTDSAVRITHLPSGLVVTCQDEKSQIKNRVKAMKVLRARLFDIIEKQRDDQRSKERKSQVGTGDRSGRIRTYNFPQGRFTDHRVGLTLYKLENILAGDIDEVIDELITFHQAQALKHDQTADSQ